MFLNFLSVMVVVIVAVNNFVFSLRDIYERGEHVYVWTAVTSQGEKLGGTSTTVRQAFRHAKRDNRRYQKVHASLVIGKLKN